MRILVTGGAGFIGSNIADAFIAREHAVTVVDDLSSGSRCNINPKARFVKCDISNGPALRRAFAGVKFDVVCHHAAQIDVRKSVADPAYDARVNIQGSINICEIARSAGAQKVIFASSGGTIYGEVGARPPDEKAPGRPLSPYGIAKYSVEYYLQYYAAVHGLGYTILRYGNVYGPRQDPHGEAGVVAIFCQRMIAGEPVMIFGDGKQLRDYVFVGDVVRANLAALTRGRDRIINIGTGVGTSVNTLFRELARAAGYKRPAVYMPKRAGELFKSVLAVKYASRVLGWKPKMPVSKGLAKTFQYFTSH